MVDIIFLGWISSSVVVVVVVADDDDDEFRSILDSGDFLILGELGHTSRAMGDAYAELVATFLLRWNLCWRNLVERVSELGAW